MLLGLLLTVQTDETGSLILQIKEAGVDLDIHWRLLLLLIRFLHLLLLQLLPLLLRLILPLPLLLLAALLHEPRLFLRYRLSLNISEAPLAQQLLLLPDLPLFQLPFLLLLLSRFLHLPGRRLQLPHLFIHQPGVPGLGVIVIDAVLVLLELILCEAEGEEPGPQRPPGADPVGYVPARLLLVQLQQLDLPVLPGLDLVIVRALAISLALAGLLQLRLVPGPHARGGDLPRVLVHPFPVRRPEQIGHGPANIYAVGLQVHEIELVQPGAQDPPPLHPAPAPVQPGILLRLLGQAAPVGEQPHPRATLSGGLQYLLPLGLQFPDRLLELALPRVELSLRFVIHRQDLEPIGLYELERVRVLLLGRPLFPLHVFQLRLLSPRPDALLPPFQDPELGLGDVYLLRDRLQLRQAGELLVFCVVQEQGVSPARGLARASA